MRKRHILIGVIGIAFIIPFTHLIIKGVAVFAYVRYLLSVTLSHDRNTEDFITIFISTLALVVCL